MNMQISLYQQEQYDAISLIRQHLDTLSRKQIETLREMSYDYLMFRQQVDVFIDTYFSSVCTHNCFQNHLSICCTREGIITFFADAVINALVSSPDEQSCLLSVLKTPDNRLKCIYLSSNGCLWRIKPIVCQMFLCDDVKHKVFQKYPLAQAEWDSLKMQEKSFTWPDRPVLFDSLEDIFIAAGYTSSLMHLHLSPGLLRIKKLSGLYS